MRSIKGLGISYENDDDVLGLRKLRPRIVVQTDYGEQSLVSMDLRNTEMEMKELMKPEEIGAGLREVDMEDDDFQTVQRKGDRKPKAKGPPVRWAKPYHTLEDLQRIAQGRDIRLNTGTIYPGLNIVYTPWTRHAEQEPLPLLPSSYPLKWRTKTVISQPRKVDSAQDGPLADSMNTDGVPAGDAIAS